MIPLVQSKNIVLSDGSVLYLERNVKVILETRSVEELGPDLASVAKTVQCHRKTGLTLNDLMKSRLDKSC